MPLAHELNKTYTYADYLNWPDNERCEIIDGVLYNMSPAPETKHQEVALELASELRNYLKGKKCRAYISPFDIRLPDKKDSENKEIFTVVQPDIVVICDGEKIDEKGCKGAPDIAVEILSPSTSYKDEGEKLKLYEKHGVKEYWIVNPKGEYIMIYHLEGDEFGKPEYLKKNEVLKSHILTDFNLDLSKIWE